MFRRKALTRNVWTRIIMPKLIWKIETKYQWLENKKMGLTKCGTEIMFGAER